MCNLPVHVNACSEVTNNFMLQVSIEGNIGCGKSTLLNYFKSCPSVEVSMLGVCS